MNTTDAAPRPVSSQPIHPQYSSAAIVTGNYRPDIDGLRALAVLLVIGFHFFPRRVEAGFIGVDVFFVISGYLITRLVVQELESNRFRIAEFWGRRIIRLFPSMLCVLVSVMLVGWFFFTAEEFKNLGKHIAAGSLYVPNIIYWIEAGYFDEEVIRKPLLHLWSLGVEEQFYIVWPLVLAVSAYCFGMKLLAVVIAALLVSFGCNIYFSEQGGSFAYYMPFTRGWQLLAGASIAVLQRRASGDYSYQVAVWCQDTTRANWLSSTGLLLIFLAALTLDNKTPYPGFAAVLPTLGAVLLILPQNKSWLQQRLLSSRALVGIGLISYPLYLWHWPILSVFTTLGSKEPSGALKIGLLFLTALLSWCTYRWFETPVRRSGFSVVSIYILLLAMLGIGCLGAYSYLSDGLPHRYGVAQFEQRMLKYQNKLKQFEFSPGGVAASSCTNTFPDGGWCTYSSDAVPTAALIGDSHAHHFFPGLAKLFERANHNLALLGNAGCPPVLGIESLDGRSADWCKNANSFIRSVAKNSDIKVVVMAANWHLYVVGKRFADKPRKAPYWKIRGATVDEAGDSQAVLLRQLGRTIELLLKNKKQVFFLKQAPELDFDPRSCIERPRSFAFPVDCKVARRRVDNYATAYFRVVDQILEKYPTVQVIDPVPQLCGQRFCPAFVGEQAIYRDRVHLSLFGSNYLADQLDNSLVPSKLQ